MRLQIEILMDIGLHSCFGEYHQGLFERYDLLYIDSSYNKTVGNADNVLKHLEEYLEENLSQDAGKDEESGKESGAGRGSSGKRGRAGLREGDWFKLSVETATAKRYLLASDFNGHVFRNQAVRYLKNYGDCSHWAVTEQASDEAAQIKKRDFHGEWDIIQSRIDEYGKSFYSPADKIKKYSDGNILELVAGEKIAVLSALPYQEVPSTRSLQSGSLPNKPQEAEEAEPLFDEYLLQKCADYTDAYENRVLYCELEYILYGNPGDRENLEQAVQELLQLRESENLSCLLSDKGKYEKAEKISKQLVGAFELRDLTEAVRDSIIYAWAYAESAIEVSRLLSGGKVMVKKQGKDWILPLEELSELCEYMGRRDGNGLSYEEYLGVFLRGADADQKIVRCMDLVEINIRQSKNESFRIDGCVEYLDAEVLFESRYGYRYQSRREFGYELQ